MWRTLPDDKAAARRVVRAQRRARREAQPPSDRAADAERLAEALLSRVNAPATVAAYVSLATEPPTEALLEALAADGHRVVVPVLLPDQDLDWRPLEDEGARLGVTAVGSADLVIVPALAIARDGLRLGQGGGSYDRALTRRRPDARVIACVYDDELAERVPADPHDQPVDAVVTPGHGVIELTGS
ncbi:5-formyltetrahydrofolate cyclo-ligase [Luteipulveratus flavus]|uniref:5-formyltetrahydrofolate cyclo-ligase n=1 Tax=Luteipulveratus flavus TaxID=3031728 RepID=A0ABT6CCB6_9MICO|nr:5-formyltetrahydrofolate cyclo-ligase [Luteipulveratus sp. YIM 133296]MDF8264911.1 5-formyltetrahydrofolate cyclo-ligase [Luteipulveratus sp. YIM 133296]